MVRIENEKLIIEVTHPAPDSFLIDLKEAIIGAVQHQNIASGFHEEIYHVNYTLMELLKNL